MIEQRSPSGWNEERGQRLLSELDSRTKEEWVTAVEVAGLDQDGRAMVTVLVGLLARSRDRLPGIHLAPAIRVSYGDPMEFEWDREKAAHNLVKHGVSFHAAASVFGDPLAITYSDPDHSEDEDRFLTFGHSSEGNLLVVSHTDRGELTRIMSARRASRKERKLYEEG